MRKVAAGPESLSLLYTVMRHLSVVSISDCSRRANTFSSSSCDSKEIMDLDEFLEQSGVSEDSLGNQKDDSILSVDFR